MKYIRLINEAFDDNAMFNDNTFLSNFLSEEEIMIILENKMINLKLRTELLRFFRMVYIDVTIDQNKIIEYRSLFCTPNDIEGEGLIKHKDLIVFLFLEKLMKISDTQFNTNFEYKILLNELRNFQTIFELSQDDNPEHYFYYFENGVYLSLKVYLKKKIMSYLSKNKETMESLFLYLK